MAGIAKDSSLTSGKLRGVVGRLERVRVNAGTYTNVAGSSGAATGGSSTFNRDGSGQRVVMTTTAVLPAMAVYRDMVYGRVVGVRWLRNNAATLVPFDVVIDGVAYPVDAVTARRDNQTVVATDNECFFIVADDLEDTEHTVEVHLTGDPALATRLEVLGFLAESGRGYSIAPEPRVGSAPDAPVSLPTALAGIVYPNLCAGFTFMNTDATDRLVTVIVNANPYLALTVPAGKSVTHILPGGPRRLAGFQWKADVAGVVNAWPEYI